MTIIIAEAGINHNGRLECALEMVKRAKEAGADIIKFQTFVPEEEVSCFAPLAEYQAKNMPRNMSQLEMIKKYQLNEKDFEKIKQCCENEKIQFLSTASDLKSIEIIKRIGVPFWKIPSNEITDLPYLINIAQTKQKIILSTGMSTEKEIEEAISVLKENGAKEIILLHCTTEYPAPYCDVNLNAMLTMKKKFGCEVGYSDHTQGIEISIAAVAMGATIIEKHFTLDRNMEGPDHKASVEPEELKKLINSIRNIERAMGSDIKQVTESERKNLDIARKSIVAAKKIYKGDILKEDMLTTKRPGNGISPMKWYNILGEKAKRDYEVDELI